MTLLHTWITTSPEQACAMVADRTQGHRMVMRLWPHLDTSTARSDLGVLWTVPDPGSGTVLVRSASTPEQHPAWCHHLHTSPARTSNTGEHVTVEATLVVEKTPRMWVDEQLHQQVKAGADGTPQPPGQGRSYRANRVPVADEELETWLAAKLARYGLSTNTVTVHRRWRTHLSRKRGGFHVASTTTTGVITDENIWHNAARNGIGKGKAYGLGMLLEQ